MFPVFDGPKAKGGQDGLVSRILSGAGRPPDDHFSGTPVTRRLEQPTRESIAGRADPRGVGVPRGDRRRCSPIWSCSRWGLPSQTGRPACW